MRLPCPAYSYVFLALSGCLLAASAVADSALAQQRPVFLQAEQALKQGRVAEADGLMAGLADYPLLPYLLYLKVDRDLDNGAAVEGFLGAHAASRQAVPLRQHWLERLAGRGQWAEYARHYQDSGSVKLECGYFLALANLGRREEAFAVAARLWQTGETAPAYCEQLFALWQASPGFTPELVWQRYALAMQKGNLVLASSLQGLLPPEQRGQAAFWRRLKDEPRLALPCAAVNPQAPAAGAMFAYAIDRLAGDDAVLAQTAWAFYKPRFAIAPDEVARIDRRTALALAAQRHAQAGAYLSDIPDASADAQIRGWRVRAALTWQDWAGALTAIGRLDAQEQNQAEWRYWRGRSLEALGQREAAQAEFKAAARERDFYGFSAADRIGADYSLDFSVAAPVAAAELDRLAAMPAFLAVQEWRALGREAEARSEWAHALKALPPGDGLAAAKLAQRLGLDNLAITTAAKAGYWDDLALRFPLGYAAEVLEAAQSQQVDPAWVYAVARRESAFDANAGSSAGALGLMQLLPGTGEMMAKRLGEPPLAPYALLQPARNLRYGAAYLHGLLEKFGGHLALAAAAYNAGPGRAGRWQPITEAMPADLWVETIPFSETRQYAAAVLFHAVVYQARLSPPPQRLAQWLPAVPPGGAAEAKPDRVASVPVCE